jgi:deoxycytidine triphosphate deaminase
MEVELILLWEKSPQHFRVLYPRPYEIILRAGMPIAQLRVEELASRARVLYGDPELHSHFQGATGPEMYRATT